MKSDSGYIFGGYSKIGYKTNNKKDEYKIDNNCFLFSFNLTKIYPVIYNEESITYTNEKYGLSFYASLYFKDNFMNINKNFIGYKIKTIFNGIKDRYEMNGGKEEFKCKELEVFQLVK